MRGETEHSALEAPLTCDRPEAETARCNGENHLTTRGGRATLSSLGIDGSGCCERTSHLPEGGWWMLCNLKR
jgi:hypothetical protein